MMDVVTNDAPYPEPEFVTPPPLRPPPKPKQRTSMALGMTIVFLGVLTLFIAAFLDLVALHDKPWNTTLILFEVPDRLPDTMLYPVQARRVSRPEPLDSDLALALLGKMAGWENFEHELDLDAPELVIALDLPEQELHPLLASGRLPRPGHAEVLAGPLAREASFFIGDLEFEVVGALHDTVSGFIFAYMLPHLSDFDALFTEEHNAVPGILVVAGETLIEAGVLAEFKRFSIPQDVPAVSEPPLDEDADPEEGAAEVADEERPLVLPPYIGGMMPAMRGVVSLAAFGLLLVALGGALFHFGLFKRLRHAGRIRWLQPALDEIVARPRLFWAMHLLLYGAFFLSMRVAINNPLLTWRVTQYIEAAFSHGGLSYVGEAYASGNVNQAAWATFHNNYIVQTLGLTFLISLFPLPVGILKTLFSFTLVGGAMAPMWVGAAQGYVIHSITMALELEAYIVACFAIAVWMMYLFRALASRQFKQPLKDGARLLLSAALLTAVMLMIAAYYEAFTLIKLI